MWVKKNSVERRKKKGPEHKVDELIKCSWHCEMVRERVVDVRHQSRVLTSIGKNERCMNNMHCHCERRRLTALDVRHECRAEGWTTDAWMTYMAMEKEGIGGFLDVRIHLRWVLSKGKNERCMNNMHGHWERGCRWLFRCKDPLKMGVEQRDERPMHK